MGGLRGSCPAQPVGHAEGCPVCAEVMHAGRQKITRAAASRVFACGLFPWGSSRRGRATALESSPRGPDAFKHEGRQGFRKRKWIAEPLNGWIKNVRGFRQFSLRRLHQVDAQWNLVRAALNQRRLCNLLLA